MGKIEDGTTSSDFDEEEVRRTISLYTSVIPVNTVTPKSTFSTPRDIPILSVK
jgi:elongation factor G